MSADFWMNLQVKFDLFSAQKKEQTILGKIKKQEFASSLQVN
jgi:plasmid maintenance system antidote protein VapI